MTTPKPPKPAWSVQFEALSARLCRVVAESSSAQRKWALTGVGPYAELIMLLEDALIRVKRLRAHTHEWNEDGYCDLCDAERAIQD